MTTVGRVRVLMAVLGSVLAVAACGGASPAKRAECLPSPLHINPARVTVGGTVTVSSQPFTCRGSYPSGHRYRLILGQFGRAAPLGLGAFLVNRDGAFRALIRIPQSASPGQSFVIVKGSTFDRCADTNGVSGSCAGYDAPLRVLPQN